MKKAFWKNYDIGLVPGPTKVPDEVGAAYAHDFASSDLEPEYLAYYAHMQQRVQKLLNTQHAVHFMTGEAMVTLWGALKSVLVPGDDVLVIAAGVFGEGFGDMARQLGAKVHEFNIDWDEPLIGPDSLAKIHDTITRIHPKLITTVHCDTPTGSINNCLKEIGEYARESDALLLMDCVSSFAGLPVLVDEWNVDLALCGSQKALSCPPEFSFLSISDHAWKVAQQVKYVGYDAILPFQTALEKKEFPYTPSWRSLAALDAALDLIDKETLQGVFDRHLQAQQYTIKRLTEMGIRLYLKPSCLPLNSPTVTAAYVPDGWTWEEFDTAMRDEGVRIGGTFGRVAGKIFRIGHMGSQADLKLLERALNIMETVIKSKKVPQ